MWNQGTNSVELSMYRLVGFCYTRYMIQAINTIEDVRTFFQQLLEESLNFHPDEDFANYINCETSADTYTPKEAELRNRLMDEAFEVCGQNKVCIYELGNGMALKYTGLDKFITME